VKKIVNSYPEKGQIALIVLLIMVVVLTVGLSVASRSVTDVFLSETKESGIRAFNAAEAGIEKALSEDVLTAGSLGSIDFDGVTAEVEVEEVKSLESLVGRNDVVEVPLRGGTTNNIKISWTKSDDSEQNPGSCNEGGDQAPASIEIIRLRQEAVGVVANRYFYNTGKAGCTITNGFEVASASPASGFVSAVDFTDIDGNDSDGVYDIALRIRTFYNEATILAEPIDGNELPLQEYRVSSSATTETGETKTIELTRSASALPAIFDYAIFSGSSITK